MLEAQRRRQEHELQTLHFYSNTFYSTSFPFYMYIYNFLNKKRVDVVVTYYVKNVMSKFEFLHVIYNDTMHETLGSIIENMTMTTQI